MTRGYAQSRLTWWSLVTVALAVPTWWFVLRGAVLSRAYDGGIFLSVAGGLNDGQSLYSGVWDNKDPLFLGVFALADRVAPLAPFLTDWFWLPVGAVGAWLLARSVMSADRALFTAVVVTPWILTGAWYIGGYSNTPGTVLVLLVLGLLARRWAVAAGIALGLLVFAKLAVAPIAIVAVLALLLVRSLRSVAVRALVAGVVSVAVGFLVLALTGSLAGYVDMVGRNRAYAGDAMTYFGFDPSFTGHLEKFRADLAPGMPWVLTAIGVLLVVATALLARRSWRDAHLLAFVAWFWVVCLGTLGVLAISYVWPHHAQFIALPAVMAAVAVGAVVPERLPVIAWMPVALVVGFLLTGWGSTTAFVDHSRTVDENFEAAVAVADETPLNAKLLRTVPLPEFRFAILGTNDEGGFLRDIPAGATLGCPRFHLYDFSPGTDFEEAWACLDTVDALIITDNFVVFGNGGKAASVQPVLGKVGALFDCQRVEDRQVCVRKRGV